MVGIIVQLTIATNAFNSCLAQRMEAQARLHVMLSAAHEQADLDKGLEMFGEGKRIELNSTSQ